jgi:hypothetical protein
MEHETQRRSIGTLLPVGLACRAGMRTQPEKRLMLAVLEGAVGDFQHHALATCGRGRRLFLEAERWFKSDASDRLLDFESVCQALALDPSYIRSGLARWYVGRRQRMTRTARIRRDSAGTRHTVSLAS